MKTTIIGIHGLANKSEKGVLIDAWSESIKEGLAKNENYVDNDFTFKMVYWADLLYKFPQHQDHDFDFDSLYNKEPYLKAHRDALKEHRENWLDHLQSGTLSLVDDFFDIAEKSKLFSKIPRYFVDKFLKDLSIYYTPSRMLKSRDPQLGKQSARIVLQNELKKTILDSKDDNNIVVIAHSMGSIIAYDVLRDLGRESLGFNVKHFITIGSPLGLPHVKKNIELERKSYSMLKGRSVPLRSPTIISRSWLNYADKKDPVAFDTQLDDEFDMNERGVQVVDEAVLNDYVGQDGNRNHHKSYGYLRTPEMSRHLKKIIVGGFEE